METLEHIPIDMIRTDWSLLRKVRVDDLDFQEMKESIKQDGILVPICVRKIETTEGIFFSLVDGKHRLTAAQDLGITHIPCDVRESMEDVEALTLQATLNIQRIETKKGELARHIHRLYHMDDSLTQAGIAKLFGKSVTWVIKTLSLNELPDYVLGLLDENKISMGNAILLIKAPEADRPGLIDSAQEMRYEEFEVVVNERIQKRRVHSGMNVEDGWQPKPERRKVAELLHKVKHKSFKDTERAHINTLDVEGAFFEGILCSLSMDTVSVNQRKVEHTRIITEHKRKEANRKIETRQEEIENLRNELEELRNKMETENE